jgi:DNA-directed RNA polymerase subunit K/omega
MDKQNKKSAKKPIDDNKNVQDNKQNNEKPDNDPEQEPDQEPEQEPEQEPDQDKEDEADDSDESKSDNATDSDTDTSELDESDESDSDDENDDVKSDIKKGALSRLLKTANIAESQIASNVSNKGKSEYTSSVLEIGLPERKCILTKYERARIIGTRATQMANGMPCQISDIEKKQIYEKSGSSYYVELAKYELNLGLSPYIIERVNPNGEKQHITMSDISN